MVDAVGHQVASSQVVYRPSLSTMGSELKSVQASHLAQSVQRVQVRVNVKDPVVVVGVGLQVILAWT